MLTERIVRDAKSTGKTFTVWDVQVKGLGLQATAGGTKNYVVRYGTADGRKRQAILGRAAEVSLKDVRERAGMELFAIRQGDADPLERRREAREAPTVREMFERFLAEVAPVRVQARRMSPKTVENYTSQARRYILPLLGDAKVAKVTRADIEQFAAKVKGAGPQRNRVLQLLSRLFTEAGSDGRSGQTRFGWLSGRWSVHGSESLPRRN